MKSKRLLALGLTLCLMLSVLSPAASAVTVAPEDAVQNGITGIQKVDDWIVSAADSLGIKTHKNDPGQISYADGQWIITDAEGVSAVLKDAQLPEHIQALRAARKYFDSDDCVAAFVVLEADPTVEQYSSIADVPEQKTEDLMAQQDALIEAIEDTVLEGEDLQVVTQFTYLTNSVVVETEFANLEAIAALDGVKRVFVSPVYYPCEASVNMTPYTVSSTQMTGVASVWQELGYTGAGMTIAIMDTGLDVDHPSFAADPANPAWSMEWLQEKLDTLELNAEAKYNAKHKEDLVAEDLYYSAKVPFTFNYAMGSTNVTHNDSIGDHGTHVAGIAAANDVEGSGVVGMAPDAQIIAMKVFNSQTGGSNMYDLVAALEDAILLGVDVVNMSLGSPAGFCESGDEEIDSIFRRVSETDMIVDVAVGNEGTSMQGSLYGNYMNTTEHIDNATVSSPATYANAMSIASANNSYVYTACFELADGESIFYMQSVEYLYAYTEYSLEVLAGQTLEYVMVPGLGEVADFYDAEGNSIVEGKIAVVSRGVTPFSEKAFNAENAGAAAVLIWNNIAEEDIFTFGMTTSDDDGNFPAIPVVLIAQADGQKMADAEDKTMTVCAQMKPRYDVGGGQMSNFSCWGVAPDLSLLPDLTGIGGNVYSCYDGGNYGLMSGTSMATPQVAGVTALVLQYLKETFPDYDHTQIRILADSLMMSTAVPVVDSTTGLEASPRHQGAGLVDALAAMTAEAYLSVGSNDRPKAELGESKNGTYSFSFRVHNYGDTEQTYTLSASLLCEDYTTDEDYPGLYFMASTEHGLDTGAVSFSGNTVTVAPGSSAAVTVTIRLNDADKEWIDTYFPNGNYVEGFVYLTNQAEDGVDLSLPFLGFYGDWSDAPVFDTGYWFENGFWDDGTGTVNVTEVEANQYYHVLWTSLGQTENDWIFGLNPYGNENIDENGNVVYSDRNNILSPNGDGVLDSITDYYLSLMRNAQWVYLTYTDADGNILDQEALDRIGKTMYRSSYGGTVPFVYSWYYDGLYDFTDAAGDYLPDGTELTLTISACLVDGDDAVDDVMMEIPIHIDTAAPELVGAPVESSDEWGNYLTLTLRDAHPAYVAVMNKSGTQIYGTYTEKYMTDNGDGTWSVTVDVTGLGDHFTVALCDYGCNESYFDLTYTLTDNVPVMDTTALYAYQVYQEYIHMYYGWDQMFGWTTMDKLTGEVTMISSDAYEYYALNAAEYAGGYIFAVDAGGNFLYMTPGIWNRNVICNLGVNAEDMSFDDTTGTMYLTTKTETDNGPVCRLYTVDLLTGDLTMLKEYEHQYEMPWAMTFVDGELYCCKYYYSGFYKVDIAGGTYDLEPVVDADGNEFKPMTAGGKNISPYYLQSMTYSDADGLIYWAYYSGNSCELITIDPETWTNTAAAMEWDQEYAGLLMLEDDGYVLPESTQVTKLLMNNKRLVLSEGESDSLSVSALPWNAPAGQITWTSSDEGVVTVDDNGVVTGVAEGNAVITAAMGSLTATCAVTVVNTTGNLYAYNYFSGDDSWGAWLDIDLDSMDAVAFAKPPFDFIAADYNGHDGLIYGYAENKSLYSFDPVTGECIELGKAAALPYDMAYDYSSGLMYAIVPDYNSWSTTLYYVNTFNGALVKAGSYNDLFNVIACDTNGQLYVINFYAEVYSLSFRPGSNALVAKHLMDAPSSELQLIQSMCYDHKNDVLLWASAENGTIYWLDVFAEDPYAVDLGEPTESGLIEFIGLFTIPEEIPELGYTSVSRIEGEDMMLLTGNSKLPSITVFPLNATNQEVTYTSDNEAVVRAEGDSLVGVGAGTATVTATLNDEGKSHTCTFQVTVKNSTDNIYAYLMQDMYNYEGYCWVNLEDSDPNSYQILDYVYYQGVYMTLYCAEYYDGKIYAYGFDAEDWAANFQYLVIDAETRSVLSMTDMGDEFPFVYDMAFDYTTGTMYAVAGTSYATDLYMINLINGELVQSMVVDPMLMSIAIDENGTIYGIARSEDISDIDSWFITYDTAKMYTLDPKKGTCKVFMDTGVISNALASMAYDYDTGYLYWTGFDSNNGVYDSGLFLIDPADKTCFNLGTVGAAGSQVTGLMIRSDSYPAVPDTLRNLSIVSKVAEVDAGATTLLEPFLQPAGRDVTLVWSSADETIATVDQNGVVTGVSAGITTVSVSARDGGKSFTAKCKVVVYGVEDYFLTYSLTDGGFAGVERLNPTLVTGLTEAEDYPPVRSMTEANGVIYAYDEEGNLFTVDPKNGYTRSYIGYHNVEIQEDYEEETTAGTYTYYYDNHFYFDVRDMAWDPVNQRLLAVGCHYMYRYSEIYSNGELWYSYDDVMELLGGCKLYEVDLQTGALTEVCVIRSGDGYASGIQAFTITDSGVAYVYTTLMDYVCKLDLETGRITYISTLQNIGASGSTDGEPMSMTYDPVTNNIYMLVTQNGEQYNIFKYNVATTALNRVGAVSADGDSFAGLIIRTHEHDFVFTEYVEATCDTDGHSVYTCTGCGETHIEVDEEAPATGHSFQDGYCTVCGASELPLGDVNGDGDVDTVDAYLIVRYYNEYIDLTADQLRAADVDGSEEVDTTDAYYIVMYYNELIDKLPAEH